MKIECPKCKTGGKLDPTRVPDTGANIRCPSCGAVFFVEKPAPAESATEPAAPSGEPGESTATQTDESPGTLPGRPAAPALGSSVDPAFRMTLSQPLVDDGSGDQTATATTPPPTAAPEPKIPRRSASSSHSRLRRLAAIGKAAASHTWKVKNTSGMVYDFPDTKSVKTWLEGRTTHSDLELSPDGGLSWKKITEFEELKNIQPRGFRSSNLRLNESLQRAAADAMTSSAGTSGRAEYRSGAVRPTRSGEAPKTDEKATSGGSKKGKDKEKPKSKGKKQGSPTPKTKRARQAEAELERSRRNFRIGAGMVILIGCAVAWVFAQQSEARRTLPDTPAGHQLAWVLGALNGEAEGMASAEVEQHFLSSSLSVAGEGDVGRGARLILNELRYWQEQYPHYQFDQIVGRATPTYLEAQLATSVGEAGIVGLEVERDPPHGVVSLWIRPIE